MKEKQDLRKKMREKRKSLSLDYCKRADDRIRLFFKSTDSYRNSRFLFCYVSMEEEVDTRNLIAEALQEGKRVAVPRCQKGGRMEAWEIESLQDLEPGLFHILEPKRNCKPVNLESLDLCVIPCLTCSSQGVRLGYGGGYYDRFLPKTKAERIVLCREKLICQNIPREAHDCFIPMIITENGVNFYQNVE